MQNVQYVGFAGRTTECERLKEHEVWLGKSRRQKAKALNEERKQRGELHGSRVWPPDVCL